jgi:hypothetical protein
MRSTKILTIATVAVTLGLLGFMLLDEEPAVSRTAQAAKAGPALAESDDWSRGQAAAREGLASTGPAAAPAEPEAETAAAAEAALGAGKQPTDEKQLQFRRDVSALIKACAQNPPCNERKLVQDQAALGFDLKLGADHPKRTELIQVAGWSFDEREVLGKRFSGGELTRSQMFSLLETHFGQMASRYGELLTDEEYQKMFELPKGQNPAPLMNITQQKALALDKEMGSGPR